MILLLFTEYYKRVVIQIPASVFPYQLNGILLFGICLLILNRKLHPCFMISIVGYTHGVKQVDDMIRMVSRALPRIDHHTKKDILVSPLFGIVEANGNRAYRTVGSVYRAENSLLYSREHIGGEDARCIAFDLINALHSDFFEVKGIYLSVTAESNPSFFDLKPFNKEYFIPKYRFG